MIFIVVPLKYLYEIINFNRIENRTVLKGYNHNYKLKYIPSQTEASVK